jgi:hypothetical protein
VEFPIETAIKLQHINNFLGNTTSPSKNPVHSTTLKNIGLLIFKAFGLCYARSYFTFANMKWLACLSISFMTMVVAILANYGPFLHSDGQLLELSDHIAS